MDKSAVGRVVDAHMRRLMWRLQVQAWKVDITYGRPGGGRWVASCERAAPYLRATIELDPDAHADEAAVVESLRHELLHLLLAPFDQYRDLVTCALAPDSPMDEAERGAWRYAVEQTVGNLERMLDHGARPSPFEAQDHGEPAVE